MKYKIPFNRPCLTGNEINLINKAYKLGKLAGGGLFTEKCQEWIEKTIKTKKCLLTHSGTAALEMIAFLMDIKKGDEIIMPSYTFVSTANAFVIRGGVPVFVDIREDTLDIDGRLIEKAITSRTKAIMVVHYAGAGCEMEKIAKIARKYNLLILEDAAHGFLSRHRGKYLGTFGALAALSFHETKNIISGEGGALLINDSKYMERANIIWEKGTDRSKFLRGLVDKYTWVDVGSSFLPSEITAAFLMAQLESAFLITKQRLKLWNYYHNKLRILENKGFIKRPIILDTNRHNAHMYYILTENRLIRNKLITYLRQRGILAVFHYVPLHSSPAGKRYARFIGSMKTTEKVSSTVIRLPLFYNITHKEIAYIVQSIKDFFKNEYQ